MTQANNGTGNNVERDEWQTPQSLWDELNKQYHFDFDCCANVSNTKTLAFAKDFLQHDLITQSRMCWMNPPFSKAKQMFEHFFKSVLFGVAIYRCDNIETEVWHNIIKNASWIAIPKGRINYEGFEGKTARFGSALIGLNVPKPKLKNVVVLDCSK